ncbi:MAG: phosphoribosylformylglycinamidine cyclo-ligase [Ponticaulis sp.]|nr:phosphoribosylformylglycinamidine cyclo-ligase [Ponticaulis sp.]|tara:strand:+ start:36729 stop:37751 length:1023 start_codon:yes stop_codon:yes gene_type:complete
MTDSSPLTYKQAGVDIDAGNELVDRIKPLAAATKRTGVASDLGGFGGLFDLKACGYTDPVLVSGTDGVGTKLLLSQEANHHSTIGVDLVAMCVNDVLAQGAEPLFFLDYFATGHLETDMATDVVAGISRGCQESGCALIGGETAEMPSMYAPGHYDLAGFVVGAVERDDILPRTDDMKPGDSLIALPSSGPHSNGYSLIRKVIERSGLSLAAPAPFAPERSLGEALLEPTRLYVSAVLPLIKDKAIKGLAHITGGGLTENIPRMLPDHLMPELELSDYPVPPVFNWMQDVGQIEASEMHRTFNMGIGMVLCVAEDAAPDVIQKLQDAGEKPFRLGQLIDA